MWAVRIAVESGQPMADVGGVADLAHLAVADDVEPGVVLQPDDLVDALLQRRRRTATGRCFVTAILGEQQVDDLRAVAEGCRRVW